MPYRLQLYRMIETDLVASGGTIRGSKSQDGNVTNNLSVDYMQHDRASFVSYPVFLKHYCTQDRLGNFDC